MADLRIGGLARLSACDWPDRLVATIFLQGCPWDCPYCHNPHLLALRGAEGTAWSDVHAFLERRAGLLDGVVFSGGEPTAQDGLADALAAVRALGFATGLHTAGAFPDRLARVLPLLDWVGFDVKAPFVDYARITGVPGSGERARESLRRVLEAGVAYEVRTTVHPALLNAAAVESLMAGLSALGVRRYVLQTFRAEGCRTGRLPATAPLPAAVIEAGRARFAHFSIR